MTKNYKFVLQENMYDCGIAALKTIFLQYGKKIKSNDVVRKTTSQGTTAYELISSSKKLGLNAKGVKTTLDTLTIKHLPCIAHIIKDKNYFHYIVIFEKNNKNRTLVILDPAIGIKTVTYEEFNEETTNIFILFDDKKMQKEKDKRFKNVIKSLLKVNKNIIIKSILLSIFYIIMTILFNYYFKVILEKLELNNVLIYSFIIFLLIVLLKNIIYNLKNKTFLKLNMKIDKNVTNNLINHIIYLPKKVYLNKTVGELSVILNDIYNFKLVISKLFIIFSIDIILILFSFIIIGAYKIIYLIPFFLIVSILLFISFKYKKIFNNNYLKCKNSQIFYNSKFIECLTSYNSIKNLCIEEKITGKLKKYSKVNRDNEYIYTKNSNNYSFINNILIDLFYVILIFLMVFTTSNITTIVFISSMYYLVLDTTLSICEVISMYDTFEISIYKVLDLFDLEKEKINHLNKIDIEKLEFNNVSYAYDDKNILTDLNFNLEKDNKIFITGKSGSGKSTLMNILLKYLNPLKGSIKLNNTNIDNINNGVIRNSITYVGQDESLFTSSINSNLSLINNNQKQIDKAIKTCLIDDVYKKNNINSYYILEENGLNLSNGERKRLLIARSLLKRSNLIIFDESFNEIDVETERKILNNIFKNYPEKKIIMISHRLNNKDLFDKCYELRNKKLVLKEE